MTNLEWLALMKKTDDASGEEGIRENLSIYKNEYRQIKALEIIAEELCLLNNLHTSEFQSKYNVRTVDK